MATLGHRTLKTVFEESQIAKQTKLLFGPLVIQLVRYIQKQLFTSVSVKAVDIYLHFGE